MVEKKSVNERVLDVFSRHCISIILVQGARQEHGMSENYHVHVLSGFIVCVRDRLFLCTAGHVLSEVERALKAGQQFCICRIYDQWDGSCDEENSIPVDIRDVMARSAMLWNEDTGLDYGLIGLSNYEARLLDKAGKVPIVDLVWKNEIDAQNAWYALVGVPEEYVDSHYVGNDIRHVQALVLMPLERIDAPECMSKECERLHFHVSEEQAFATGERVESIQGMSGGPVFAFMAQDNELKYQLLGVQSAWLPKQRLLAVCPMREFLSCVESRVDKKLNTG